MTGLGSRLGYALAAGMVLLSACSSDADPEPGAADASVLASGTPTPPSSLTGFTAQTGPEILAQGLAAGRSAGPVSITGYVFVGPQAMLVEAHRDQDGTCGGTVEYRRATARFVSTGDATYLKAGIDFWGVADRRQGEQFVAALDGRWAKIPVDDDIDGICDLDDEVARHEGALDDLVVGWVTPYDDHKAAVLVASEGDAVVLQLYVDVEEPHHLLGYEDRSPGGGALDYFDFGTDKPVRVPRSGEFVALGRDASPV